MPPSYFLRYLTKATTLLALLAAAIIAPVATADDPVAGDLNADGVANVQDVALMVSHLQAIEFLPSEAIPLADINGDGLLTETDVEDLVNLILEREPTGALELARILQFSPANGEFDVSPTRETVVRFSMPLNETASLTNDNFYATFAGKRLLTRVELSSDRMKATLFYLDYLPSGSRIRVTFDGTGLTDFLGRPIAVNGNGSTTNLARSDFETLSYAPVANTGMVGTVYASEKNAEGENVPLEGVVIEVVGDEERTRTTTNASGEFNLTPVPAGRFFVNVDGRPVTGGFPNAGYYPFIGKAWTAVAGISDNPAGGGEGLIYLPYVEPAALVTVSSTEETEVEFSETLLQENPELAGTKLLVPANSLFANDGTRGGSVGMAPVDPNRLPEPLPPGLDLPLVITIQTDGATNFDIPVPLTLPNTPDPETGKKLAPGERSALWSFNHDIGEWEIAGPMRVTDDGLFLVTEPGVGVRQPGWHGQRPGSSGGGGGGPGDVDEDAGDDFTDLGTADNDDGPDQDDLADLDDSDDENDTADQDDDDCEANPDDCEDCKADAGVRSVAWPVPLPSGAVNKFVATLNKIPRVNVKADAVAGEGKLELQDCCPDPKAKPITNGIRKGSMTGKLSAKVTGQIWGPPTIEFDADFKVALVSVKLSAGVFVEAEPSVQVAVGLERNDCKGTLCSFFEFSGNLSLSLFAQATVKAQACIGYKSWAVCGGVDIEVTPAKVSADFKGFIKADTCTGLSGGIGLDAINFIASLKAFGVTFEYKYKIY